MDLPLVTVIVTQVGGSVPAWKPTAVLATSEARSYTVGPGYTTCPEDIPSPGMVYHPQRMCTLVTCTTGKYSDKRFLNVVCR
jgi:hypothetical protein